METRIEDVNRWGGRGERLGAFLILAAGIWLFVRPFDHWNQPLVFGTLVLVALVTFQQVSIGPGLVAGAIVLMFGSMIGALIALVTSLELGEVLATIGAATVLAYYAIGKIGLVLHGMAEEYNNAPESSAEELLASQKPNRIRII